MPSLDQAGKRRRAYHRRRQVLIERMGGCCHNDECGAIYQLEFHHRNGKSYVTRRLNRLRRITRYEREFLAGDLALLCRSCNARKQ
jgi:hypothetical protein